MLEVWRYIALISKCVIDKILHQKVFFISLKTVIQNNEIVNHTWQTIKSSNEGIIYIYTTDYLQDVNEIWISWIEIPLFPSLRLIEW